MFLGQARRKQLQIGGGGGGGGAHIIFKKFFFFFFFFFFFEGGGHIFANYWGGTAPRAPYSYGPVGYLYSR